MNGVVDNLEQLAEELASMVDDAFAGEQIAGLPDDDLMRLLDVSGRVRRRLDAVQIEAAVQVQVQERSDRFRDERLTARHGCDRPADLLCMVMRIDRAGASRLCG
ncbi:hypothetical protein [Microbacterium sp. NPDC057650]|uniref:hypothetical protein n=1 Tax=unclassified Microbacterium TaxID=2609290 RepID=UPI00367255B0